MGIPEKINKQNVEDILALAPMQEAMLFQYLIYPESKQYFEQASYKLSGKINEEKLIKAWTRVVSANEMLRTIFRWEKLEKPIQIVLKNHQLPLKTHDLSELQANEREKRIHEIMASDREEKICLREYPMRIILCKLSEHEYVMILSNHHIIFDGWSNGIILKELIEALDDFHYEKHYEQKRKNRYKEFIKWNKKQDKIQQKKFWSEYLKGFSTEEIKDSGSLGEISCGEEKYLECILDEELEEKITQYTRQHQITFASLMYAAWGILLHKFYNILDVFFGTTVSGRTPQIEGIQQMVGLFINTIPLRIKINPEDRIDNYIKLVNRSLIEREEYESTSMADIIIYRGLKKNEALFNSVIVIQNYPLDSKLIEKKGILNISLGPRFYMTKIDLALGIRVFDKIILDYTYNTNKFNEESIKRLSDWFVTIIKKMLESNPESKISYIEMIDSNQRDYIRSSIVSDRKRIEEFEEVNFDETF